MDMEKLMNQEELKKSLFDKDKTSDKTNNKIDT